jgi:GTPase SAR1 family protein
MFNDSNMSADPFRVLVVGERGVGKSQWIQSLRNSIIQDGGGCGGSFPNGTYVPYPNADKLSDTSMLEYVNGGKYSRTCRYFIMNPEMHKQKVVCHPNLLYHSIDKTREYHDMLVFEYPSTQIPYPFDRQSKLGLELRELPYQYDCLVIMGEYSDITSLRSIYHWCLVCGFSPARTIICINKCDVEPACFKNDFQSRKARVINHFVEQCAVEYISAKEGVNEQFIYKYMRHKDFRNAMKTPHIQKHIGYPHRTNRLYREAISEVIVETVAADTRNQKDDSSDEDIALHLLDT